MLNMKAFYALPTEERVALTRSAVGRREPLMVLWEEMDRETTATWSWRAKIAAEWLADAASVVDLGCGNMELEAHLRPEQVYIPIDIVRRDRRTIVADFNRDELPSIHAEACAALAVLEYMLDVSGFLKKLRERFPRVVTSFVHREQGDAEESRLAMGWINHFDHGSVRQAFEKAGYAINRDELIGERQRLYDLRYRRRLWPVNWKRRPPGR